MKVGVQLRESGTTFGDLPCIKCWVVFVKNNFPLKDLLGIVDGHFLREIFGWYRSVILHQEALTNVL